MKNQVTIHCQIYMEAEDIKQSRIQSTASYVQNLFLNCSNTYFHKMELDNESDMEDFTIRLYIDHRLVEEECSSPEDAKSFLCDMMECLDQIALSQSYLDMEGKFSIEYQGEKKEIQFTSEMNEGMCDFVEA